MNNELVTVQSYQTDGKGGGKREKKREKGCQLAKDGWKRPVTVGNLSKSCRASNQDKQ